MKKHYIAIIVIAFLILLLAGYFFSKNNSNQSQVVSENNEPLGTSTVSTSSTESTKDIIRSGKGSGLVSINIVPMQIISNGLEIKGKVPGYWFFEGSSSFDVIQNSSGGIVGTGLLETSEDWMTENLIEFKGVILFKENVVADGERGSIIIKKENASGLPQHNGFVEIPIVFKR